jgi:hypothetical protein
MTQSARQFYLLLALGAALFILVATDTHRTAIQAVWPLLEAFWDYQAK